MPADQDSRLELHWEVSHFLPSSEACALLFVRGLTGSGSNSAAATGNRLKAVPALSPFLTRSLSSKVFISPKVGEPDQCAFFFLLVYELRRQIESLSSSHCLFWQRDASTDGLPHSIRRFKRRKRLGLGDNHDGSLRHSSRPIYHRQICT